MLIAGAVTGTVAAIALVVIWIQDAMNERAIQRVYRDLNEAMQECDELREKLYDNQWRMDELKAAIRKLGE